MSFLDRFQNKIATVTAHGHLKKADGSEEIRVGPPKRKTKAPIGNAESNSRADPPPAGKQQSANSDTPNHSSNGNPGKAAKGAPVPLLAMPSSGNAAKQQHQLNPSTTNHGKQAPPQQQHSSPSASPRNKSGRDANGYDNNHSHRDNYHHHYDANNIPGRLKEDSYHDEPQYTSRSHETSKSPSPTNERYAREDDNRSRNPPTPEQQYQQPQQKLQQRNRSPWAHNHEASQKELRSPKEINESRVQSDHDQLAFSRKARLVQYEPCKLSQYKKEKPAEYYELGKLQPDLNSEDLVQKRANAERIKAFSKNLRVINKSSQPKKGDSNNDSPPPPAAGTKKSGSASTRSKALEFAKRIPKPKHSSRSNPEEPGTLSSTSSNSNIQSIATVSRPINSVLDDDSEDDQVSSELQQLQLRHQASRAQVEALIKKN